MLARGFAELGDQFLVVVRVDLQQVAGGRGSPEAARVMAQAARPCIAVRVAGGMER